MMVAEKGQMRGSVTSYYLANSERPVGKAKDRQNAGEAPFERLGLSSQHEPGIYQ